MNDSPQESDWHAYRQLVLSALTRIEGQYSELNKKIDSLDGAKLREISDIRVEIGMIKARAMVQSSIVSVASSGVVSIVVGTAVWFFTRGH